MKPTVRYIDLGKLVVGESARALVRLHPLMHQPVPFWVRTSIVQRIRSVTPVGPVFETMNSIYTPIPTDESLPDQSKRLEKKVSS